MRTQAKGVVAPVPGRKIVHWSRALARTRAAGDGGHYTYKLFLAYDGTAYDGWQAQPGGNTVQQRIEAPLAKIFGERIRIHGAGRTDAGVHAHGQVASFAARKSVPPAVLVRALNANLPEDVRVLRAAYPQTGFHARISAKSKEYRYQIVNAAVMQPFLRAQALHHPRKLDLAGMRLAGRALVGRHDFVALSANPQREVESTMRTIHRLTIVQKGELITIAVCADGFLYKMVRGIVGALLKVGRGEATKEEVVEYVRKRKRTNFVQTAPAHGLCLWKVWY